MSSLAQYILSVASAAILCAVMKSFSEQKGTNAAVANMLCGIFLMFTILSPLKKVNIMDFGELSSSFSEEGVRAAAMGSELQKSELRASIKTKTEAYIWDKANSLQAQLQVEVTLSDDDIPVPVAVRLSGRVSPYAKSQLQEILENDLGIAKENQLWT